MCAGYAIKQHVALKKGKLNKPFAHLAKGYKKQSLFLTQKKVEMMMCDGEEVGMKVVSLDLNKNVFNLWETGYCHFKAWIGGGSLFFCE